MNKAIVYHWTMTGMKTDGGMGNYVSVVDHNGLLAENAKLRGQVEALRGVAERVVTLTHNDAVNGHLFDGQELTQAGIEEIYESTRAALSATEEGK